MTRLEEVLHDLICHLGLFQEELARVKSQLAQAERGSCSETKFASLCEQLPLARMEWGVSQGECDRAQLTAVKMA